MIGQSLMAMIYEMDRQFFFIIVSSLFEKNNILNTFYFYLCGYRDTCECDYVIIYCPLLCVGGVYH